VINIHEYVEIPGNMCQYMSTIAEKFQRHSSDAMLQSS